METGDGLRRKKRLHPKVGLNVNSNHPPGLPPEPAIYINAIRCTASYQIQSKRSKGKRKTQGIKTRRAVGLRGGGIVTGEQRYRGHVSGEGRTQISRKAACIRSVAQGTTCLLMQLLPVHLPRAAPAFSDRPQKTEPDVKVAENLSSSGP